MSADAASLKVRSLSDLMHSPPKEPGAVLAPWWREAEAAMLYAPTGAGKSMLALTLALAIAGGGEVLGWGAPTPRRVLLVDGEMSEHTIYSRLLALMAAAGLSSSAQALAAENIGVLARQGQAWDVGFPDLATDDGGDQLLALVEQQGAQVVVLDNLSTLASVADENAASSFTKPNLLVQRLKQQNVATLVIHHAGKGSSQPGRSASYRGSSNLATTFDAIVGLTPLHGSRSGEGVAVELVFEKYRHAPTGATGKLDIRLEPDSAGVLQWKHEQSRSEALSHMVALIRSGDVGSWEELAAGVGAARSTVILRVQDAERRGLLQKGEAKLAFRATREAREAAAEDASASDAFA